LVQSPLTRLPEPNIRLEAGRKLADLRDALDSQFNHNRCGIRGRQVVFVIILFVEEVLKKKSFFGPYP
jgi:hypothetical protein